MKQLTITLPAEIAASLKDASQEVGVKPEDFMFVSLQEKISEYLTQNLLKP